MSNDVVSILSIDGGGIRGIIPAMVVKELLGELKAGREKVGCYVASRPMLAGAGSRAKEPMTIR